MKPKKYLRARGFHDYGPKESIEREYIIERLRKVFRLYGFLPLETPAVERAETLLEQHGGEAQKLIFHLLDSGDYLKKAKEKHTDANVDLNKISSADLRPFISSRLLRYDFTASLRRYLQEEFIFQTFTRSQSLSNRSCLAGR